MTTPRPPDEVFCMPCFDTSALSPDETAEHVAAWVRQHLDALT